MTTGVHEYIDCESVSPGGSAKANIKLISPEYYPECLCVGKVIPIQEGSRIVAHAEVTKIYNLLLAKAP